DPGFHRTRRRSGIRCGVHGGGRGEQPFA
ncbi:MAG: hypothetical protein AVDCRST_MAG71-130, partial [uncultured Lysobacter sp.]